MNFQKYSGAGNTFLIANNLHNEITDHKKIVVDAISQEKDQSDGVIFIEKSDIADYRMNYFNKDGTGNALCGNGLRCTARYISENLDSAIRSLKIEAVSSVYETKINDDGTITTAFPPPARIKLNFKLKVHFEEWWELLNCSFVDVGSPHIVVFIDEIEKPKVTDIEEVRIIDWGRNIRMHKDLMPEGANVNFVRIEDADKGVLSIRSYERGVEGETLACGTGALSTAIVYYANRKQTLPVTLITKSGENLIVDLKVEAGKIKSVTLTGSAKRIK